MLKLLRRSLFVLVRPWATIANRHAVLAGDPASKLRVIVGFSVVDYARRPLADSDYAKVEDALCLIADFDPKRFARLRRDIERIGVIDLPRGNAAYVPDSATCFLDATVLAKKSSTNIAILLVHEATHARIENAGIRYWPDLQPRIERRAMSEEIAFVERLPTNEYPSLARWIEDRRAELPVVRSTPPGHAGHAGPRRRVGRQI